MADNFRVGMLYYWCRFDEFIKKMQGKYCRDNFMCRRIGDYQLFIKKELVNKRYRKKGLLDY